MCVSGEDSEPGTAGSLAVETGPEKELLYSTELFDALQSYVVQAAFTIFLHQNHSLDLLSVPPLHLPRH